MPNLEPNRRAHIMLRSLACGPLRRSDLVIGADAKGFRKAGYALAALQAGELVKAALAGRYSLTEAGSIALERLDRGEVVYVPVSPPTSEIAVPNARFFGRTA